MGAGKDRHLRYPRIEPVRSSRPTVLTMRSRFPDFAERQLGRARSNRVNSALGERVSLSCP